MEISVVIPAAGSGRRMGLDQKKQFLVLEGLPVIVRTIQAFLNYDIIKTIIVVTSPGDLGQMEDLLRDHGLDQVVCVPGGKERQDSVYQGLCQVKTSHVMVHDGARPFVSQELIAANIEGLKTQSALITAIPVKDTIKEVEGNHVKITLDRSSLVQVQTPQSFETLLLKAAYDQAFERGLQVTDDASVVEAYGQPVGLVAGSSLNVKLTLAEDLVLGAFILRRLS